MTEHEQISAGLSEAEAKQRLASEGFNELARQQKRTALRIALETLREPMFLFLVGAGAIYLMLGETSEALVLSAFATTSIVIAIVQEFRSERVLEALKDLTSPRALVVRGGRRLRIAGRDVVRGDILIVSEGDRIAADGILLEGDISADESLLTGESVPVRKVIAKLDERQNTHPMPGGEDTPFLFSGTLVVRGQGIAEVVSTGSRSEIGKIGTSLATIETEPARLKAEVGELVRVFSIVGGAVCLAAFLIQLFTGHSFLKGLLSSISLGMAMLPEEFPLVLAVFTVMGAWRLSRANVLTRRASAIEALGEATVLCTDKTGTLTENRMAIAELWLPTGESHIVDHVASPDEKLPDAFKKMIAAGALASQAVPIDPMDRAFVNFPVQREPGSCDWRQEAGLERSYGVTPKLMAVTNVWRSNDGDERSVATKGAPEAIAALCRLTPEETARLGASAEEMGTRGLRVLAVAAATTTSELGETPDTPLAFRFTLLGLVGLADPVRENVKESIRQCREAGIRVVMITGDYPATALAIARTAGIDASEVVGGSEIATLDGKALRARVTKSSVFARISPADKLRIIEALQANGEIAAMIGDGVNDAPTLKAAHIGIAMGGRGTDVAREAAALVLLDDDFTSVVKAICLGRRIFDNLRKATGFIAAIHVPIAGLALFPLVAGLPPILEPLHIAFLELIIDPVCSIVFEGEPEDDAIMRRPPRPATSRLLSLPRITWCLAQGLTTFIVLAALFAGALWYGLPAEQARSLAFGALIAATMALVLINRTFEVAFFAAFARPNPVLWGVFAVASLIFGVTLAWEPARRLFDFGAFHGHDMLIAAGTGLLLLFLLEGMKAIYLMREK